MSLQRYAGRQTVNCIDQINLSTLSSPYLYLSLLPLTLQDLVESIREQAARNNQRIGLGGMMSYNSDTNTIVQYLEGPQEKVCLLGIT